MPVEDYAGNYLALKIALEQVLQRPVDLLKAHALCTLYSIPKYKPRSKSYMNVDIRSCPYDV